VQLPAIQLNGLVKRYGRTEAVRGVDLTIDAGQAVALLGPSGCGKTTTLKCIAGLEDPSEGQIMIDGKLVAGKGVSLPPEKRDVGMVFQSYALWPHMTVFGNVAYPLEVRRMARDKIRDRTNAALESVGLGELGERLPSELSGGQQQRVALARSMVASPKIVLFDEPLSNLDAKLRTHMRGEIKTLLGQLGITALYVTHDRTEAMAICDRIVLMHDGQIVQDGSPEDLYRSPANLFAADFMGGGNVVEGTVRSRDEVDLQGHPIRCRVPASIKPGDPAKLVLRGELLHLSNTPMPQANSWRAKITQRLYLGARTEYVVTLPDNHQLRLEDASHTWQPGHQAHLWIAPEDTICLPKES
jgi:ABC-type Fe3+/spermidine/putrescine transport system ATPase subunit